MYAKGFSIKLVVFEIFEFEKRQFEFTYSNPVQIWIKNLLPYFESGLHINIKINIDGNPWEEMLFENWYASKPMSSWP